MGDSEKKKSKAHYFPRRIGQPGRKEGSNIRPRTARDCQIQGPTPVSGPTVWPATPRRIPDGVLLVVRNGGAYLARSDRA